MLPCRLISTRGTVLKVSSRPCVVGPAVVTSPVRRHQAAAPQALPESLESAYEGLEDNAGTSEELLQVEAAAVADESLKISNCNLSPSTVQALEKKGIKALFPIQKSVFDPAMAGTDLVARARTGSGKTLAFSLPIIEALLRQNREDGAGRGQRAPRALILAPTRELAKQVAAELQSATNSQELSVLTVYGGTPIGAQIRQIERGVDVLVGTPGRVIDLVDKRQVLQLSAIQFFVLDEADEMLNMGFQDDVEAVLASVPESRQTMMFSATMPQWVRKLARKFCKDYIMVDLVGEHDTGRVNSDVKCLACTVPPDLHAKRLLLVDLITLHSHAGKTIVFCNTKRECETVVSAVSAIMPAEALHGDIQQDMREFTMARFREGKTHVLVATDVAARGLDVNNVDLVVHWDVPQDSETYLHRSGRTGRAGNKGTAIMMIGQRDKGRVADIIRDTKVELDLVGPPTPQAVLESVAGNIEQSLVSTSGDVAKYFEGTASRILENGVGDAKEPAEVLAVVMAQISGYTELPKERSLLGQAEGYVTIGICTPRGQGFPSPGALIGSIRRITDEQTASAIGKVELFDDVEEAGFEAAFDVPVKISQNVIDAAKEHGAKIEALKSLPLDIKKLVSYRGGNSGGRRGGRGDYRGRYGGNNRGRGDRGWGGNDRYGSRSGNRSRGGGRGGGGGYGDRQGGRGWQGQRSSSWGDRGDSRRSYSSDGGRYSDGGGDRRYGGRGSGGRNGGSSRNRYEFDSRGSFESW